MINVTVRGAMVVLSLTYMVLIVPTVGADCVTVTVTNSLAGGFHPSGPWFGGVTVTVWISGGLTVTEDPGTVTVTTRV